MAKRFEVETKRDLEKKRADADRSLYRAKCRFVKWDLSIRLGRAPTKNEIIGIVLDNPLTILEVRERIRMFKREELAKRKSQFGYPINTWENLPLPGQRRNAISEADAMLHLQLIHQRGKLSKDVK